MAKQSYCDFGFGGWVASFRSTGSVLAVMLLFLAGCQDDKENRPTVSLEEAKQVTASFKNTEFTPPPKTITDITALLDESKNAGLSELNAQRAMLDAPPPASPDPRTQARFYYERGAAATRLGRFRQGRDDLSRALEIVRAAGINDAGGDELNERAIIGALGSAEYHNGNLDQAIRHRERYLELSRRGQRISASANLSIYYARQGNLKAAESLLAEAELGVADTYMWREQRFVRTVRSLVQHAKGLVSALQGRFQDAENAFRRAITIIEEDMADGVAPETRAGAGHSFGDLRIAIKGESHIRLGEVLLRQNRLSEGEIEAREALKTFFEAYGRYSTKTVQAIQKLTRVMTEQGRIQDAEVLARSAIDILEGIGLAGDATVMVEAHVILADILSVRGRWREAGALYQAVKADLSSDPATFQGFVEDNPNWALGLMKLGKVAESLSKFERLFDRTRQRLGDKHYGTAEIRGFLAAAQALSGRRSAAFDHFRQATPILLQRSRRSASESTSVAARERRLRLIIGAYIRLLSEIDGTELERSAGIDAASEAFRLADVVRGQTVQRALAASSARAAARDPALSDLARREQDTQKRIESLYGLLADAVSQGATASSQAHTTDLRRRIDTLRGARAAIAQEIERRFPAYAQVVNPKPATLEQAQASLRAGESLIATFVDADQTYVWAVPKSGDVAFAVADLDRDRVAAVVADLRRALDPRATTLGDIPRFDVRLSTRLFEILLEPVSAGWKASSSLLIVADGPLGQLPFSVLVTDSARLGPETAPLFSNYRGVSWLARSHAVTVLPSVSSLVALRNAPAPAAARRAFAGFGDPQFSTRARQIRATRTERPAAQSALLGPLVVRGLPLSLRAAPRLDGVSSADLGKLPPLPDTGDEIRSIALALNADLTRDVFTGAAASESRVRSMDLSGYKVIAFATHGLVPGDLNGLTQPALALSAPEIAGGGGDGLLTMSEILGLRLDADWVVLSACNTASGRGAGAEAVSGLGRAFFYAGTRALLVSNWPVESTSARALTTNLFTLQSKNPTMSRAEALRRAMISLMDGDGFVDERGRAVYSYAHPLFWAPFSLIGDGGGAAPTG